MPYFRGLPNFEYISNFPNQSFNTDYTVAKNIFKRAKLREDIANAVTAFQYYQIIDNERPDQIAAKVYNNADLDWVILISNNITNIKQQWPLDNNSFYKYLIEKYGSDEELGKIHHYETEEVRDEYNRVLIPGGLQVDSEKQISATTVSGKNDYTLSEFPSSSTTNIISINLNQYLPVYGNKETTNATITDITKNLSTLKVLGRTGITSISVSNSLTNWPTSWGGTSKVKLRDETEITIQVNDFIFDNDVELDPTLYEIVGEEVDGEIVPVFKFKVQI